MHDEVSSMLHVTVVLYQGTHYFIIDDGEPSSSVVVLYYHIL